MSKNLLKALSLGAVAIGALVAGDCGIKSGAYAGISAGVSHLGGKNEYVISNSAAGSDVYSSKGHLSSNSFLGSVFAGYGYKLNLAWLAAELGYKFDNLKSQLTGVTGNKTTPNITFGSKSKGAFEGAFHVGFVANASTIAYAILGVESRNFKVQFADSVNEFTNSFRAFKKSYRSTAFVPGLGVRFNIAKNLNLRTEYKCAMHKTKKIKSSGADRGVVYGAGTTDTLSMKHNPMIHSFAVGAAYTF